MGRRSLGKIDPALDLSYHLRTREDLTPWAPEFWFDNQHEIEVEVGSGKGLFMVAASVDNPDRNFLGVEISRKYAKFCASRLAKRGLQNGIMMSGDAQPLFKDVIPDQVLMAVHIYFPDPWWKKRHHKRRIMNRPFLDQVYRTLNPDGKLHFWTDVRAYYTESLELIRNELPFADPVQVEPTDPAHDLDYRTHFERRMRMNDAPVYRCCFTK